MSDDVTVHHGDALDVLATMPDASVDAVVTDPPYGLEFMGKDWDAFRPTTTTNRGGAAPGRSTEQEGRWVAVEYGTAKRRTTLTCDGCGKSDKFKNPHGCPEDSGWTRIYLDNSANNAATMRSYQQWCEAWAVECLRLLKPGGHLLAFGGTRTFHRLACAVEDAGFEIRDTISWLYGSGFPKSLDVSKAIDRAAGAEREVVGRRTDGRYAYGFEGTANRPTGGQSGTDDAERIGGFVSDKAEITAPATDDARRWQGFGTSLKPAWEPVVVARKPLAGTVAANVLAHGTGALNIDGTRVGAGERFIPPATPGRDTFNASPGSGQTYLGQTVEGRWPANVVLDEDAAAQLDRQSGTLTSPGSYDYSTPDTGNPRIYGNGVGVPKLTRREGFADFGGASRFYYTAKAAPDERPFYYRPACDCEEPWPTTSRARAIAATATAAEDSSTSKSGSGTTGDPSPTGIRSTTSTATSSTTTRPTSLPSRPPNTSESTPAANSATGNGGSPVASAASSSPSAPNTGTSRGKAGHSMAGAARATSAKWSATSVCGECGQLARREAHATVKPLDLIRWLVRLVTPPGGLVLDPFAGSGTTGEACLIEGFRCVLIEREADYLPLIQARLSKPIQPVLEVPA